MRQTLHTACNRDCPDACGIVATVDDGRVVAITGDKQHPITRGFLCERTSRYLGRQYSPDRVTEPQVKHNGSFMPASWDAALDLAAERLRSIRDQSGAEAVLHYRSGGSLGILKTLNDYFFECFGGARVKRGDICSGAGESAQEADLGLCDSHALEDLLHSRCILLWGKNVVTSFVHMLPVLKEARRRGAWIAALNPVPSKTDALADFVVRPRPGTDRFLALGMARSFFDRGLVEPTLADWSHGSEAFRAIALSRTVAEWARAADVAVGDLELLAERYGAARPGNIQVGWGLQRRLHGSVTIRVLDALAALAGNWGVPGGGVSFYYRRRGAFAVEAYRAPDDRRGLREPLLGQDILEAQDPPVRAVVVDNGNPVAMLPDSHTVQRALATRDFVLVLDSFLTDTGRQAHVFLPVTTMLEEEDALGAFGHHYLIAARPVARRPPGVKTDLEIYQALAERLGFGDRMAGTPRQWIERFLSPVAGRVTYDALLAGAVRNPLAPPVLFEGRRFATLDGRFHFVTEIDVAPETIDREYPLGLGAFSTPAAQSSQWSRDWDGRPLEASCHPQSANGIADGAVADVVSRIGRIRVVLRHDPRMRPELLVVPKGGWLAHGSAANVLVRARPTDSGLGAAYYDEQVRLEAPR